MREKYIWIVSIGAALIAWLSSFLNNYILTYNDAASHLNIARRVIDNLTPGIAQIGTVWLPLTHVLMLPFAWNDLLWQTGFAGSIVSMSAYIIGAVFLYKLLYVLTENVWGATIGTSIYITNPNLLYMQSTPMTEPVLITLVIASIYYLARFIKNHAIFDLIVCSVCVSASTLVRYDGWFLFICIAFLLPIWTNHRFGIKRAESTLILFLFAGGFGIFLWVLWNYIIFSDALYFIRGPYSAAAQQVVLKNAGKLPTQGSLYTSIVYYGWSIIETNGIAVSIASFASICILPFIKRNRNLIIIIILLSIFSPIIFNVIALYLGQSAINILQASKDPGLFNIRYGMMALPAISIVLGIVASQKYLRHLIVLILVIQILLFVKAGLPITLVDGLKGLENTQYTIEGSKWFKDNYQSGLILTSLASHDAFVARTQLPMKLYVHEGTRDYWKNSLEKPSDTVTYIATMSYPPDLVFQRLKDNPDFIKNYLLIYKFGTFEIYIRK